MLLTILMLVLLGAIFIKMDRLAIQKQPQPMDCSIQKTMNASWLTVAETFNRPACQAQWITLQFNALNNHLHTVVLPKGIQK